MPESIFLRLLPFEDKAAALTEAVDAVREGRELKRVAHQVDPESFRQVPGSPFAYWVSERMRRLFTELPPFEAEGRFVRVGLQTSDDFRFLRAWWEISTERILDGESKHNWNADIQAFHEWCQNRTFEGKGWLPFAKGGEFSPYTADIYLVVKWENDASEVNYHRQRRWLA